jgi:hypothetical protein
VRRFPIVIAFLVALMACSDEHESAPTAQELAGSYVLSGRSASYLIHRKGYAVLPHSEIRISVDGTIEIYQMPDAYVDGHGHGSGKFVSGAGRWAVEPINSGYGLTLNIEKGESMEPGVYHGSSILIKGRTAPFRLDVQLGDPDNDESITFERQS